MNKKLAKNQQNVLKSLILQLGRNIIMGYGIFNISMPVNIFKSKSFL